MSRVALMDFTVDDNSYPSSEVARDFTVALQAELSGEQEIEWVERSQLRLAEKELRLSALGLMAGGDPMRQGKWVKADWLVQGRFTTGLDDQRWKLTLRVVDLSHADLLAEQSLDWGTEPPSQVASRQVSLAAKEMKALLAAARTRSARAAGQIVIAPLFFYSGEWFSERLNALEKEFPQLFEAMAATRPSVRLLRFPKAYQAIEESELAAGGWVETPSDCWQHLADVYVWGSCSLTNTVPSGVAHNLPAGLPRNATFQITLSSWDGQNEPRVWQEQLVWPAGNTVPMDRIFAVTTQMVASIVAAAKPNTLRSDSRAARRRIAESLLQAAKSRELTPILTDRTEERRRFEAAVHMLELACFFDPENAQAQAIYTSTRWGWWMNFKTIQNEFWSKWRRHEAWGNYVDRFGLKPVAEMPFPYRQSGIVEVYLESTEELQRILRAWDKERFYGFPKGVPATVQAEWSAQLDAEAERRFQKVVEFLRSRGSEEKPVYLRFPWGPRLQTSLPSIYPPMPLTGTKMRPPTQPEWIKAAPAFFQLDTLRLQPPQLPVRIEEVRFPVGSEVRKVSQLLVQGDKLWIVAQDAKGGEMNAARPDFNSELNVTARRLWVGDARGREPKLLDGTNLPEAINFICGQGDFLWVAGHGLSRLDTRSGHCQKFGLADGYSLADTATIASGGDRLFAAGDRFKVMTADSRQCTWEELPIGGAGEMFLAGPNSLRLAAWGKWLACTAGSVRLYNAVTRGWTNVYEGFSSGTCTIADETGFWFGTEEWTGVPGSLHYVDPETFAFHTFQSSAAFQPWTAPSTLSTLQSHHPQSGPRGNEYQGYEAMILGGLAQFRQHRELIHTVRALKRQQTDPADWAGRLPGGVGTLANDGEFLWVGSRGGYDNLILLLHKPSRSWVGCFKLPSRVSCLAASDRHLWIGMEEADQLLLRIDKTPLMKIPRRQWVSDRITTSELADAIGHLPLRDQALHAFFTGDYARVAELLAGQDIHRVSLESLFLLGFSYDSLGMNRPEEMQACFNEILARFPDTPWARAVRAILESEQARQLELARYDQDRNGRLDAGERETMERDPVHVREEQERRARQTQGQVEQLIERFDSDGDSKLTRDQLRKMRITSMTARPSRSRRPSLDLEYLFGSASESTLDRCDTNHDGMFDAAELTSLALAPRPQLNPGPSRLPITVRGPVNELPPEMQRHFDFNGNGILDPEERHEMLPEPYRKLDRNKNGVLEPEESGELPVSQTARWETNTHPPTGSQPDK
jgi:hypothetical protein